MEPNWTSWAKRLNAIAQNGLTFAQNSFDVERYEAVRRIAAEILADRSGVDVPRVLDLLSHDIGYATPKVDVRAAIFRNDALLLVKEREDGCWTLPGGWADVGEAPSESVAREVAEECGYQVHVVKLLAVYDRSKHPHEPPFPFHIYKLFFRCAIVGGQGELHHETSAAAFFRSDALPPLSATRVTPDEIERMFEHQRHPDWPTDFD